jgi:hypothetical protein
MTRTFGTAVGPNWSDVLVVLEDYFRTYGVVVALKVFPLVGGNNLGRYGVSLHAYDQYGERVGIRTAGYAIWPSVRFKTFNAMCYYDALQAREWVIDCAKHISATREYPLANTA